jgi:hypothetical protein
MRVADLNQFLVTNHCLIVHCASYAQGIGQPPLAPLERLQFAIAQKPALPCSTIKKGDVLDLAGGITNYTGTIGVVIVPTSQYSISTAQLSDAGSDHLSRNLNAARKIDLPLAELESVVRCRPPERYNEVFVSDYEIAGVFFDRLPVEVSPNDSGDKHTYEAEEIVAALGDLPYFYLTCGTLISVTYEPTSATFLRGPEIAISDIYKPIEAGPL